MEDRPIKTLEEGLKQMGEQIKSDRFAELLRSMMPESGKLECRIVVLRDRKKGGMVLNMAVRALGEKKQRGTLLDLK